MPEMAEGCFSSLPFTFSFTSHYKLALIEKYPKFQHVGKPSDMLRDSAEYRVYANVLHQLLP